MTRLFVAVRPPSDVVDLLAAIPRPPTPHVTWARPEQLVVKLRPLGHVDPHLVDPIVEALTDELAGAGPVSCTLGPATRRLAGQWLGVPVTGLDALAGATFAATVGIVPVTHPQPVQVDVVVARGRVPATLAGAAVQGHWQAHEVVLVADRSAPRHHRLEDLAAIRL